MHDLEAKGDGFQVDALCEDGLCFQFYFRNDPANVEYTKTGLLPLHSCVMTLFDSFEDNHRVCGMGNLYNYVTFCKRACNHKGKLKVRGVTRKGMRRIPGCVVQEEQKSRKKQLEVGGTKKSRNSERRPKMP